MAGSIEEWLRADSGDRQLGLGSCSALCSNVTLSQLLPLNLSFLISEGGQ